MRVSSTAVRRRDELVLHLHRADDANGVLAEASARLRRLVPFDAAVWFATEPDPAEAICASPRTCAADSWSNARHYRRVTRTRRSV